jgi:hypothetical protein
MQLTGYRGNDIGMGVAMHQRCRIVGEINSGFAIDIGDAAAFSVGNVVRMRLAAY